MKFKKLTAALDMYGCPNRCKHCWVGHSPNGKMTENDLIFVARSFRPYAESMEVFDWYREPDYKDNYERLWQLRTELSDIITPHYELVSIYRTVRDRHYVEWLSRLGVKRAQITLFGGEAVTDRYTGRRGAYREILQAMDILMENGISPRLQIFVNRENVGELPTVERLIRDGKYIERCRSFGGEFACFIHQGSCDGENEKLYGIRVTPDDLRSVPPFLSALSAEYFNVDDFSTAFGQTERELYGKLISDNSVKDFTDSEPVFFVDNNFDVYPNITAPAPFWRLGNLKTDGAGEILDTYLHNGSVAQHIAFTTPVAEIVEAAGDPDSLRLFDKDDYLIYLINKYCRSYRSKSAR